MAGFTPLSARSRGGFNGRLVISLVQALTQIQDQTLQFLIKLLAVSATLLMTYHWMGATLLNYTQQSFLQITSMRP
ncbi:type III secretion system protein SsaS [Yersinia pestis 24H]|nr:type III secretion system protein SsaS [Yersinia pestis 9]ETO50590.1 type III secretion system protein SsaS [Yersinia pestis 24H]